MNEMENENGFWIKLIILMLSFAIFVISCPSFFVIAIFSANLENSDLIYYSTMMSSVVSGIGSVYFYKQVKKKKSD